MKILEPRVVCDFSDTAVEQALIDLTNHHHRDSFGCILNVSVFDAMQAIHMMIDSRYFRQIHSVHVTPEFKEGEFSVHDDLNSVVWKSLGA